MVNVGTVVTSITGSSVNTKLIIVIKEVRWTEIIYNREAQSFFFEGPKLNVTSTPRAKANT